MCRSLHPVQINTRFSEKLGANFWSYGETLVGGNNGVNSWLPCTFTVIEQTPSVFDRFFCLDFYCQDAKFCLLSRLYNAWGLVVSTHRFSVNGWTAWEALLLAGKWFRNKRGKNARGFICLVLRTQCDLDRAWGYTSIKMEENHQCISAIQKKNWGSKPFWTSNLLFLTEITQSMWLNL